MSTKKSKSDLGALIAQHQTLAEAKQTAVQALTAARNVRGSRRAEDQLAAIEAEIVVLQAKSALAECAATLDLELHVQAVAAGDADAIAADLSSLEADVSGHLDRATELEAQVKAERQAARARLAAASDAHARIAARRQEAGLPVPAGIPMSRDAIRERIAQGARPPASSEERINRLAAEARTLRADLERALREREERQRELEAIDREREKARKAKDEANQKELAEQRAAVQQQLDDERELAEAWARREAGGAA